MPKELAYILVGDHLGQVKKVLWPSGELSTLTGYGEPSSSKPIVSIETIFDNNKQLVANKSGQIYIYDCIQDTTTECQAVDGSLVKALPLKSQGSEIKILYVYEKQVVVDKQNVIQSSKKDLKKGEIKNAKVAGDNLAVVGKDIALKVYDVSKRIRLFDSDPPEKDWLGIRPETFVSGVDFIGNNPNRIATCSKSDSVVRIYDTKTNSSKPVISIDINQTAFNEHADSARFISLASADESSGTSNYPIVIGSNVGQILAIDIRSNIKQVPNKIKKKKFQPKPYKVLGGFKGSRGASVKDIKIVTNCVTVRSQDDNDDNNKSDDDDGQEPGTDEGVGEHKVISCSLDRYMRIHNFTKRSRHLDKHVFLTTKPMCCCPVFYNKTH